MPPLRIGKLKLHTTQRDAGLCMSIARHAGLETPEFWLSDDRKLFVIRRFDLGAGGYLGFEDMAALMGRHPSRKYEGTYGDVARAIADFVAPPHRQASLDRFFRLLVLDCVIFNGDAHLKNFGILYGDPSTALKDARLSPVYDLVCTTVYLSHDVLALGLRGSKAWPDGVTLERFGREACGLQNVARTVKRSSIARWPSRATITSPPCGRRSAPRGRGRCRRSK